MDATNVSQHSQKESKDNLGQLTLPKTSIREYNLSVLEFAKNQHFLSQEHYGDLKAKNLSLEIAEINTLAEKINFRTNVGVIIEESFSRFNLISEEKRKELKDLSNADFGQCCAKLIEHKIFNNYKEAEKIHYLLVNSMYAAVQLENGITFNRELFNQTKVLPFEERQKFITNNKLLEKCTAHANRQESKNSLPANTNMLTDPQELLRIGYVQLFNGKDLSGWSGAKDGYTVKDNCIMCQTTKGGVLFYGEKQYKNFEIYLEYHLPKGGNNGLALKYPGVGDTAYQGLEIQILDNPQTEIDPRQKNGAVYGIAAPSNDAEQLTEKQGWNRQKVLVHGSRIKIELNGKVILDKNLNEINEKDFLDKKLRPGLKRTEGFVGFAGHSDPVMFRNIWLKELE